VRELADSDRIQRFMKALGAAALKPGVCYLTGGSTAVLMGWRATTVDVDIALEPEQDELLHALQRLKDELAINVELASPLDFIPLPDGWRDRSPSIGASGVLVFRHFDLVSQVLAKLERGHLRDLEDVRAIFDRGLVTRAQVSDAYDAIESELYRFPAVDPRAFRSRVEEHTAS
jgi:hypothetical protein